MADSRVASRYVKSLLGLAVEKGVLEEVHKDMNLFTSLCRENRAFTMMLRSPVIRHEKKKAVLDKIFAGKVNALTLAIIDIITRKNREPILPAIAAEFHNAYNEYKGIGEAQVTTTIAMDKELRASLESIVKKLSNKQQVEIKEQIDPSLIGGFVLHVGDRQIDASVKGKLKVLSLKFNENYFAK
ncbi:MAG TPA: ATP synthase F1 subunit delta [Cyclobacteriaceae bacterium]|nr:ATP synthase F1 subunit delta [Cyclobacteriaceae bacterium]